MFAYQVVLRDVLLQGVMAEQIGQHVSGFSNWLITKHEQGYLEAFEGHHDDLVYLTAGTDTLPFSPSIQLQHCTWHIHVGLGFPVQLLGKVPLLLLVKVDTKCLPSTF